MISLRPLAVLGALLIALAIPKPLSAEPLDPRLYDIGSVSLRIGGDWTFRSNVERSLRAWGRFDLVEAGADAVIEGYGDWVAEGFLGELRVVDAASGDVLWAATRLRRSRVASDGMAFEQLILQLRQDLQGS